jgi:alpha-glucosidase
MNEPANFALPSKTLFEDSPHRSDHGPLLHAEAHNVYGMQMARSSHEGALACRPNERPFVITRAGYAGVQRYSMIWTGDNSSVWEHLADSVQMFLNLSVSGLPFCGGDVGGFLDNTTPELLVRWLQMACFTPFLRNHTDVGTIHQEPWAFGRSCEELCRNAIEFRYQLLPYLYCLFLDAHRNGAPIMRPMFYENSEDREAVPLGDQFYLGPCFLVAPILRQGARARSVYLPAGSWFNFWSGEMIDGGGYIVALADLDRIPLFVKAGSAIPFGPVQQFVGEKKDPVMNLHIWSGGESEFLWYEDDGISMSHLLQDFSERKIVVKRSGARHRIVFGETVGSYPSEVRTWRVILRQRGSKPAVKLNQETVAVKYDKATRVAVVEIPNRTERFEMSWR